MRISNLAIYGLDESILRSGYAMIDSPFSDEEFKIAVNEIHKYRIQGDYEYPHIKRAIKLANSKGGGHNQYLSGIITQFDLTFSNKAWVEAERYKFLTFITSMSTMHRISKMNAEDCCNGYVFPEVIDIINKTQKVYQEIDADEYPKEKQEAYLKLLYNLPSGFEITAGITTNYRCLRNIYEQRHEHRLPDWREFCEDIKTLPMAIELIIGTNK